MQNDYGYILTTIILFVLFILSLKKRESRINTSPFIIDKNITQALRGVACIMILMGHYGSFHFSYETTTGISKIIWFTFANIALTWFMYFSGYGLSISNNITLKKLPNRIHKVYMPLLFVCIISFLLYFFLPDISTETEKSKIWELNDISLLKEGNYNFSHLIPHYLGINDWYIMCIIIFYIIFYFSVYFSNKYKLNITLVLFISFLIYYVISYFYFGLDEAHYYRYTWVFFVGHIIAKYNTNNKKISIITTFILTSTIIFEGTYQIASFIIAFIILYILSIINRYYTIKGKTILYLGSISYFYYLCHIRISYTILHCIDEKRIITSSLVIWILFTIIISHICISIYNSFNSQKSQ